MRAKKLFCVCVDEYFSQHRYCGKYACIMPFTELADARLAAFKKINESVLDNSRHSASLMYGTISLWACEQQLLWERLAVAGRRKRAYWSALISCCARITAYAMLVWLILRMRLSRARVLVYGIDLADSPYIADGRMAGIYLFLKDAKIAYGEIFHTIFGKTFFMNIVRRRRSAFYLDIAYGSHPAPEYSGMPYDAVTVDRLRAAAYLPKSIAFIRRALRLTGARAIFAIDDTRYYYPLMIAAKECGIPFYAFQHGRFSRYMPGWAHYGIDPAACPFPEAIFVWSDYWRSTLLGVSPTAQMYSSRVRVGGSPDGAGAPAPLTEPSDDGIFYFLIPQEDAAPEAEIAAYIRALLAGSDIRITYKLRRGRPAPSFIADFSNNHSFKACFDITQDEWVRTDAVLGSYSTFLYEAIALGRPVGILDCASAQASDLIHNKYAAIVRIGSALSDAYDVAATPWNEVCRRQAIFRHSGSLRDTLSGIIPV